MVDFISFAHSCTGLDSTRFTWNAFIKESSGRWNALALDQRGWGESPLGNEDDYDAAMVTADIETALQERFGDQKVVLVGHSMGGRLVMKFAADYPERCVHVDRWLEGRKTGGASYALTCTIQLVFASLVTLHVYEIDRLYIIVDITLWL